MSEQAKDAEAIFLAALEKPADECDAYVDAACAGKPELLQHVRRLLEAHAETKGPLDVPLARLEGKPDAEGPGTRIGPYKLLQKLGEGGMGVVFLAEQQEPVRRMVALKIIKQGMDSAQVVARFESERQALALMDHPNIARVLDAGTTDAGRPYFVMELIKGIPITKFCDQEHLTPRERLDLFIPVCQAVQHAHQKGVIHRDLKPSNVMIALYDGKPVPKVIDFGIAKATTQKLTDRTLFTEVGSIVGTLEYMAPEQAELNNLDIDTRADIYALGVLLYELLTGSPPFSAKDLRSKAFTEMLRIIREVEPPRPSTKLSSSQELPAIAASRKLEPSKLTRQVRGDLDWIVMKCLEKERGRRYETANAVVQDIQRYLTDEPVLAGPPSAGYRLRKFVKRNRGMVTAASVVLLTVLLGIIGTTWGWLDAEQARDDEEKALTLAVQNEQLAEKRRAEAEKLAAANKLLADNEGKARREAENSTLRIELEYYLSKAEEHPDLALVGMASLLPKAGRLDDPFMVNFLRLQIGAWSRRAARLNTVWLHQDSVVAVALSRDGKTALTGSNDNTARLWETQTGKPIGLPLQHAMRVGAVVLSADGKTALTGSNDKTAQVWDAATGKPTGPALQHPTAVGAVALSADGKTALTASENNRARLWDTTTGKLSGELPHAKRVAAVALSADGKTALTGSWDHTGQLWDTATGKPIGSALQHIASVIAVAISADSKTALTGSEDGTARLWDAATAKPIGLPLQHKSNLRCVALSADGKIALTGSWDHTARLWETATSKPIGPPLQHRNVVIAVALSADGKIALTAGSDKTARLWETATGEPIGPSLRHNDIVFAVALSGDGKTVLTGSRDNTARLWETPAGNPIEPLQHRDKVFDVVLSADGRTALTGCRDHTAQLWETATGKPIGQPLQHRQLYALAVSADGKTALTGGERPNACAWETATGKPIGPPQLYDARVLAVALSADGKTALAGGYFSPKLWETATGKPIGPRLPHLEYKVVVLSADGKTALMRTWDDILLRDTMTGKPVGPTLQHKAPQPLVPDFLQMKSAALSADGKIALTAGADKTARLWDTATGKLIAPPMQHQDEVIAVALSADGKTALTGSKDYTARVWNTATGKAIGPPLQHQDYVFAVAVSADGKTALTGSHDKTGRLWDTATGKPIGPPLQHQDRVVAVALSADGRTALTGSVDHTARLWKAQPLRGDAERILLWAQVITGLEVDELTAVRVLDAAAWQQRRDRLQKLGGPPDQ